MLSELKFYLTLLLRRLHYVLIPMALGGAVGATLALTLPAVYSADARLVVEREQIPDRLAASTVSTGAEEQLEIIRARLLSRNALLDLADRFELDGPGDDGEARVPGEIVADMRDRVSFSIGDGSPVTVRLRFRDEDPQRAAAVVNELVTRVLREDVQLRTGNTGDTLAFFQQEVERLDGELAEHGARIVAFQSANAQALPENVDFLRTELTRAQARLIEVEAEEALLRERRREVEAARDAGRPLAPDAAEDPQAAELARLRETYLTSTAVLSPENPRMRVLRARIDALEQIVAERERVAAAAVGDALDGLDSYALELRALDARATALADARGRVEAEIDALQSAVSAAPANGVTLATLRRDYDAARRQYDQAVQARAAAETGDMIEALSKGQRVSVIEQASAPDTPDSPDRPRLVLAGLAGGAAAGLALVALLEVLLVSAVRRPVDIVRGLEITPIAVLPFMRTARERRARRLVIAAAFALALLIVPALLWAVDRHVMPLPELGERLMEQLPLDMLDDVVQGLRDRF